MHAPWSPYWKRRENHPFPWVLVGMLALSLLPIGIAAWAVIGAVR